MKKVYLLCRNGTTVPVGVYSTLKKAEAEKARRVENGEDPLWFGIVSQEVL